jgi:hypothetical protein
MEQQEALDALTDPSLTPTERRAARTELAAVEDKLGKAKDVLQGLVERRETLTAPWVTKRLKALQGALQGRGKAVRDGKGAEWTAAGNEALRQALARAVLDPEAGMLSLYWHHALDEAQEVPVMTRWSWEAADLRFRGEAEASDPAALPD